MSECLSCGAETSNGLALCEACQIRGAVVCDHLATHFRNLARWRPGHAGSRSVPGSRVLYDGTKPNPTSDRVGRALNDVGNAVTTWARALHDDRGVTIPDHPDASEADDVDTACRIFTNHLTTISTLGWCGEWLRELVSAERRLSRLVEQVVPGWYAGACRRCGVATYVVPGLSLVKCGGCGVTTFARDHLEIVLTEARPWVARPMRLAEALVALLDSEQSVPRLYERIKKWEQRDKIIGYRRLDDDGDEVGAKRYQLGDVLDLLRKEGQTRTASPKRKAS